MSNCINFVINSLEPYQYEILNFLALPKGSRIRLRYSKKWIDIDSFSNSSKEGLDGALFFNYSSKFDENAQDQRSIYFPLRKVSFVDCQRLGDFYYFILEVKNYFDYPASYFDSADATRLKSTFTRGSLVFIDTIKRELNSQEFQSEDIDVDNKKWVRIVENLIKLPAFEKLDFYRISKFSPARTKSNENVEISDGVLQLQESTNYNISVSQLRKVAKFENDGFEERRGIQVVDSECVVSSKPFAMAVGKYDVLKLPISTKSVKSTLSSTLQLEFAIPDHLKGVFDNFLNVDFSIVKVRPKYGVRLIVALAFTGLYLLPALSLIPQAHIGQEWQKVISDISLIGFTVTLADIIREFRNSDE